MVTQGPENTAGHDGRTELRRRGDILGADRLRPATSGFAEAGVQDHRHPDEGLRQDLGAGRTGDEVQALKAGIMEIADIFVVNKADRDGTDRTVNSIEAMLSLHTFADGEWRPPIMKTEATTGRGVPELLAMIEEFKAHTAAEQGSRRRARAEWRLRELLGQRFMRHVEQHVLEAGEFDELLNRIAARATDPYTVVDGLFDRAIGGKA